MTIKKRKKRTRRSQNSKRCEGIERDTSWSRSKKFKRDLRGVQSLCRELCREMCRGCLQKDLPFHRKTMCLNWLSSTRMSKFFECFIRSTESLAPVLKWRAIKPQPSETLWNLSEIFDNCLCPMMLLLLLLFRIRSLEGKSSGQSFKKQVFSTEQKFEKQLFLTEF